ncbi:MAG: DNA primase [Clostridia bacterium]|nr:DNA primase [Clostridia bacterium]
MDVTQQTYNSTIEEIKNRCNIVDVVSSLVSLKQTGSNFKGICPFHNEKTPSFVVSQAKQIFTCFGCGATGDAIEFVKKYYNLSFPEAVERLALQYGIDLPSSASDPTNAKESYYEINRQAARFFYDAFTLKANPGFSYMKMRGIEPKVLQAFGVGYADNEWQSLTNYFSEQKIEKESLLELGLVSEKNGKLYDKFRSRIMFPIINTRGKVIGFGGRIVADGEPKYLNSQESRIFQKKFNLFGLNLTKGEIQKEGYAILVEGYMDVIGLYQHGVKNVAASLGTALTEHQARLLKRYTEKVVLCYDSDEAGIEAALRGIDILREANLDVRVLHVDDGKDPDEYIKKHGKDDFLLLINQRSLPDIEYKIALLKKKYRLNDTVESVKFLQGAAKILRKLAPVEADLYIRKVALENGISEGALRREVYAAENQNTAVLTSFESRTVAQNIPVVENLAFLLERTLIRLIILNSDYFSEIKDYPEAFFSASGVKIVRVFESLFLKDQDFELDKIKEALEEEDLLYLEKIIKEIQIGEKDREIFNDCISKLTELRLEKRKNEILDILSMTDEDTNPNNLDRLMKEFVSIEQRQRK